MKELCIRANPRLVFMVWLALSIFVKNIAFGVEGTFSSVTFPGEWTVKEQVLSA